MRIFCWILSLICAISTKGFSVRGPAMPLLVQLGTSVTLPCSVDTPLPLRALEVQWMREDSGTLVHLFQEGESRAESQSSPYSGRAEFFTKEISKGNYSLLLKDVTAEDKGLYKCVVHTRHESNETKVKIDIERLVVTGADGPVFAYVGGAVILNCSVDTHVPVRELEVEWMKTNGEILVRLFSEGQIISESQHERFIGRAEFFSEEIPKGNFSLKLRDVKTEDRGEFMCKVHTDRESINATAWLQDQGFSTLHMCVLGLTAAAAVFAVLSCIPAVWSIKKEQKEKNKRDKSSRAVLLYCLQVSVPCILLCIAFAIWGKIESSVGEAYVCSALNLMRILVLFKVAPYKLHGTWYERLTDMALPLEWFIITTGVNSVILTYLAADATAKLMNGFFCGVVLLSSLSAVFSSGLKFSSGFGYLNYIIGKEIFFLIFAHSAFGFTAVLIIWFIVPDVLKTLSFWGSGVKKTKYGYLCIYVLNALQVIFRYTVYLLFLEIFSEKDKEHPALMCFCAFLIILTTIMAFDHRSNLPAVPHVLLYVFGSAVLSVLNSVALATEVFLKAEKGERTVEDLRVIILPLESLFLACWLVLQVYAYWMQKEGFSNWIKEQLRLIFQSCKRRSQSPTASQQNQMPEEKMVPLSPPAQSKTHRQRTSEEAEEMLPISPPAQSTAHREQWMEAAVKLMHLSQPGQNSVETAKWFPAAQKMYLLSRPAQSTAQTGGNR